MNQELIALIDNSTVTINTGVDGNYLAQATVDIGGTGWQIKGFLIGATNSGKLWCSAPYAKIKNPGLGSRYAMQMEENCWEYLSNKIIAEYQRQTLEHF